MEKKISREKWANTQKQTKQTNTQKKFQVQEQ
jgi:hypothetical protein